MPSCQFLADHMLDDIHSFAARIQAGNMGEIRTAGVQKGFPGLNRDFFQCLKTIRDKARIEHRNGFCAAGSELFKGLAGIGL